MKRYLHPRNATSGFTLLELLVAILIVAVLMAIVAPSWGRYLANRRVATVQGELKLFLEEAQTHARARRINQVVTLQTGAPLPTVSVGETASTQSTTLTLGGGALREGVVSLNAPSNTITFDHRGIVTGGTSTPFVIRVESTDVALAGRERCVIITTLLGGITTDEGAGCNR